MSTYICFLLIKKNWSHIDDQLLKLLPIIRRIKTEKYYHDSDKLLSLYSTLLLSYMLEDYYHIDNALHNIVWENNKKPILKGFPNIDFSYSHTKGAILHMAHPNGRVCGAKRPKCEAERSHHL